MKKHTEAELEQKLKQIPQPQGPEALKAELIQSACSRVEQQQPAQTERNLLGSALLLRAWLPRLTILLVFSLGTFLIVAQSKRLPSREDVELALKQAAERRTSLENQLEEQTRLGSRLEHLERLKTRKAELDQLRREQDELQILVAEVDSLIQENQSLQSQVAQNTRQPQYLLEDPMGNMQAEADSVKCVSRLKNLGIAFHQSRLEGNPSASLVDLIPRLNGATPLLACPADASKTPLPRNSGQEIGPENIGYEWLLIDLENAEPNTVLLQCPVHQHVCLFDHSVHQGDRIINGQAEILPDGSNQRLQNR